MNDKFIKIIFMFVLLFCFITKVDASDTNLKDIENKSAHFKTVLCLYVKNEEPLFFEGQVDGRIVPSTGDSGFAYDPIFYCYELKKTFGEASKDEKNSVSHRGKALQKLVEYLINTKQIEK